MVRVRAVAALVVLLSFPLVLVALLVMAVVAAVRGAGDVWWMGPAVAKVIVVPLALVLLAGVRAAWRLRHERLEGPELSAADHPRLWAEVEALAGLVGTRPPDRIVVVAEPGASVSEADGERDLAIGLPLLATFTVGQVRAVVAHELGHYARGDTALSATVRRGQALLGAAWESNGLLLRVLLWPYLMLTSIAGAASARDAERSADEFSVRVAGREAATSALRTIAATDLAWMRVNAQYLDLFALSGRRASISTALREMMRTPKHVAAAEEALAEERGGLADSHPPLRERIRALEALAVTTTARPLPGGDAPAAALLAEGDASLEALEGDLLRARRPLAPWDEVVAAGMARAADVEARRLGGFLRHNGHRDTTAGVLDLLQGQDGPDGVRLARVLGAPRRDREAGVETATDALETVLASRLGRSGVIRHVVDWSADVRLETADGTVVDLAGAARKAVTEPGGGERLRAWLTGLGVTEADLAEPLGDVGGGPPVWLAAVLHAKGPWKGARDVHLWTTGVLALPIGKDDLASDRASGWTNHAAEDRGYVVAAEDLETVRARPEALWWPVERITGAQVQGRVRLRLRFALADGDDLVISPTTESTMLESPESLGAAVLTMAASVS